MEKDSLASMKIKSSINKLRINISSKQSTKLNEHKFKKTNSDETNKDSTISYNKNPKTITDNTNAYTNANTNINSNKKSNQSVKINLNKLFGNKKRNPNKDNFNEIGFNEQSTKNYTLYTQSSEQNSVNNNNNNTNNNLNTIEVQESIKYNTKKSFKNHFSFKDINPKVNNNENYNDINTLSHITQSSFKANNNQTYSARKNSRSTNNNKQSSSQGSSAKSVRKYSLLTKKKKNKYPSKVSENYLNLYINLNTHDKKLKEELIKRKFDQIFHDTILNEEVGYGQNEDSFILDNHLPPSTKNWMPYYPCLDEKDIQIINQLKLLHRSFKDNKDIFNLFEKDFHKDQKQIFDLKKYLKRLFKKKLKEKPEFLPSKLNKKKAGAKHSRVSSLNQMRKIDNRIFVENFYQLCSISDEQPNKGSLQEDYLNDIYNKEGKIKRNASLQNTLSSFNYKDKILKTLKTMIHENKIYSSSSNVRSDGKSFNKIRKELTPLNNKDMSSNDEYFNNYRKEGNQNPHSNHTTQHSRSKSIEKPISLFNSSRKPFRATEKFRPPETLGTITSNNSTITFTSLKNIIPHTATEKKLLQPISDFNHTNSYKNKNTKPKNTLFIGSNFSKKVKELNDKTWNSKSKNAFSLFSSLNLHNDNKESEMTKNIKSKYFQPFKKENFLEKLAVKLRHSKAYIQDPTFRQLLKESVNNFHDNQNIPKTTHICDTSKTNNNSLYSGDVVGMNNEENKNLSMKNLIYNNNNINVSEKDLHESRSLINNNRTTVFDFNRKKQRSLSKNSCSLTNQVKLREHNSNNIISLHTDSINVNNNLINNLDVDQHIKAKNNVNLKTSKNDFEYNNKNTTLPPSFNKFKTNNSTVIVDRNKTSSNFYNNINNINNNTSNFNHLSVSISNSPNINALVNHSINNTQHNNSTISSNNNIVYYNNSEVSTINKKEKYSSKIIHNFKKDVKPVLKQNKSPTSTYTNITKLDKAPLTSSQKTANNFNFTETIASNNEYKANLTISDQVNLLKEEFDLPSIDNFRNLNYLSVKTSKVDNKVKQIIKPKLEKTKTAQLKKLLLKNKKVMKIIEDDNLIQKQIDIVKSTPCNGIENYNSRIYNFLQNKLEYPFVIQLKKKLETIEKICKSKKINYNLAKIISK